MLSKNLCKGLACLLVPALSGQACSGYDTPNPGSNVEQVQSALTGATTSLKVTDFKGATFDGVVEASHLRDVAQALPGVHPYLADGENTQDPLSLFTAATSRIRSASGESVTVVRTGDWLQAPGSDKRLHWDAGTSTLSLVSGSESGSVQLPTELEADQAEFVAAGLAHFFFGEGTEGGTEGGTDAEVHAAWGAIIAILVIIITGVLVAQGMAQSCCDRGSDNCNDGCVNGVKSYTCKSGVSGGGSGDVSGVSFNLAALCVPDCDCEGDFGTSPGETEHPWL